MIRVRVRVSAEFQIGHFGQKLSRAVNEIFVLAFDHDAAEIFGAGVAQEHAALAGKLGFDVLLGLHELFAFFEGDLARHLHVEQDLRIGLEQAGQFGQRLAGLAHDTQDLESGEEAEIIQESSIDSIIEPGTKIKLTINTDKVNIFTADGSDNMVTGVQNDCANA